MSDASARTFRSDFRRFFVRGLAVVLPSVLTLWIVVKAYQFIDTAIAEPINRAVRVGMNSAAPYWEPLRTFDPTDEELLTAKLDLGAVQDLDGTLVVPAKVHLPTDAALISTLRAENIKEWWARHWYMNVIGLGVAVVSVYIAGRLLGGYIGRRIYGRIERLITTLPVFKQVYPYVKQIVDFIFGEDKTVKFNRVVMVQYPSKGLWSMGFQTGPSLKALESRAGDAISVFIPSAPTPFTGWTVIVPRVEVIEVPLTVEEALRYIVSGGVLVAERVAQGEPVMDLIPIPVPPDESLPTPSTRPTIAS